MRYGGPGTSVAEIGVKKIIPGILCIRVLPPDGFNIAYKPVRQGPALAAVVGPYEELSVSKLIEFLDWRRHEHQPVPFISVASIDCADAQMILDVRQLDETAL
jgi:hypothetical protein